MNYALATLWHERQRFLPGVLAVAFSALLVAMQCGLLLGLFSITSLPVDRTEARTERDVWVGSQEVLSVDLGRPIPESHLTRVAGLPGVERCEFYLQAFAQWTKPDGGSNLCMVVGSSLEADSLGVVDAITPEMRVKLTEPGAIVIDRTDASQLGVTEEGMTAKINGNRVRVVGFVEGINSLAGPYVFCSESTARTLLKHILPPEHTIYILARCESPQRAQEVTKLLREQYIEGLNANQAPDMAIHPAREFSFKTRMHWLMKTKAGIALGYAALLGLIVGAVVTSQTLYAATASQAREYAILLALGIPRWRISVAVMTQSLWVGVIGVGIGIPSTFALSAFSAQFGAGAQLPWQLILGTIAITLTMALLSGLLALRSVRSIEPMQLLR